MQARKTELSRVKSHNIVIVVSRLRTLYTKESTYLYITQYL